MLLVVLVVAAVNLALDRLDRRLQARLRGMRLLPPPRRGGGRCWRAGRPCAAAGGTAISAPGQTVMRLAALAATPRFWRDVGETGQAFAWALLLSMAAGLLLGVALGLSRAAGEVVEPILVTFYACPR